MKRLNLVSIEEANAVIDQNFDQYRMHKEVLPLIEARGRILGEDIESSINVPDYRRSTVDGYAVSFTDLDKASTDSPVELISVGRTEMG